MYVLLPGAPAIDFTTLLVTFVLATLLGFLSHAPGSLGVFDAAMLIGLSQFDKNELLASLLIFRLLYFILPFIAALAILSLRELWLSLTRSERSGPPAPPR
jgi:glycosyltransferase 2 family protein